MGARALGMGMALGLSLLACGPDPAFRCEADESCAPDGRCEAVGFCSFPDPQCPSGHRFAEHAGERLAGTCVDPFDGSSSAANMSGAATHVPSSDDGTTSGTTFEPDDTLALTSGASSTAAATDDTSGSSGEPSTLDNGLVLHLPLDDDFAAGVAVDVSGNELHAQCDACPQSVPGRVGAAAGFSTDSVLFVPDDPLLRPKGALSVSVWALDADPQSMQTQFLVGKVISGVYNTFQISTSVGAAGRLDEMVWRVIDSTPTSYQLYVPNPLEADVWHHLAGVWDGATATLYLDGASVGQVAAPAVAYDAGPFVVGADNNDGFLYYWRGAIDEVRFYDRALTEAEIAELAAQR